MTQAQDDRRLMAILFTDIAGYTTLTERDESTAIRVREHQAVRTRPHIRATSLGAQAAAIRVPTLVVHGDKDLTVRFEYGVKLASLVPGARFEIIHGGDHGAFAEPRALKLVTEFLAQPD